MKISFFNFTSEEGRIGFAYFKSLIEKNILKAFIPYSRSLLKPIECRMEFEDVVGVLEVFKSG